MNLLDNGIILLIAAFYNLLVHHLGSMMYNDLLFEDKVQKTIVFLLIAGIAGLVFGFIILKPGQSYKDSVVSKGLGLGGIILIITSFLGNWENMTDQGKLLISSLLFVGLIIFSHKYIDSTRGEGEEKGEREQKDNNKKRKN